MPQIYLAGFDVFRRDAIEQGARLKQLCQRHGLQGLYPMDNQLPAGLVGQAAARRIYQDNLRMIADCDAVLANLEVFRGLEPDSGTAFEVGMAAALGKPVWGYFSPVADLRALHGAHRPSVDSLGFVIEDFGLPRNLMLACSWAGYSATAEEGVQALAGLLADRQS
ncbi:nucleoside 2-deoxyribosyltransferase [Pseudomonas sp. HR96]|uniref:nucleoside 2-deoxyribosyltransferase n=1 Tax=Pseudomonas sp. HR96 TaxID=1027966 RepID=UPI002A761E07|nr:nucleoside 2-deoxyribosyltransferase [Pseudomonas sp. HR96]WPP01843.1 nucleoside 2-deoxyribosyltransferase [Pseudomonas sp. HR96]